MRINTEAIPVEGLTLAETVPIGVFDLETYVVKASEPVEIKAEVSKISNAVTVELSLHTTIHFVCSRCLEEFAVNFRKDFRLNYEANRANPSIVLDNDIRQEIILDYPIKPLCQPECKGLCVKCGENLNKGSCKCRKN